MTPHPIHANLAGALFVWPGQALFVGLGSDSHSHRHHAQQIVVALEPGLWVGQDELNPCWGFVADPNISHQVDAEGILLLSVWSERDGLAEDSGLRVLGEAGVRSLQSKLVDLNPHELDCGRARGLLEETLHLAGTPVLPQLDPRVAAILRLARSVILEPRPLARLAQQSGLSPDRLRHLFREQMGLSMQRYVVWQRLFHALEMASSGLSLTEAAHAAAFADSSHLTRVFRETFGLKPSAVFGSRFVLVRLCSDL